MNKREVVQKRMRNLAKLKYSCRSNKNRLKLGAESLKHFLGKAEKFYELRKEGVMVVSEAEFLSGGRDDLYDVDNDVAFEVVVSEGDESIIKKKGVYPCEVRVIRVEE